MTVTTYDSAFRYMDLYGNRFALLIFDEVHHLPSPSYTQITEMALAPHRLGLTATYERPDGLHGKLEQLVGPHAEKKIELLDSLLKRHHGDRILVFTASTQLVYRISETSLIPALTHHTKGPERKRILDRFRSGHYSVPVTSRVLNEGVDVPEANVAIVLSGTGSPVEHLQRLGRILRKMEDKEAVVYEIVTRGTKEFQISYRRRRSDAYH